MKNKILFYLGGVVLLAVAGYLFFGQQKKVEATLFEGGYPDNIKEIYYNFNFNAKVKRVGASDYSDLTYAEKTEVLFTAESPKDDDYNRRCGAPFSPGSFGENMSNYIITLGTKSVRTVCDLHEGSDQPYTATMGPFILKNKPHNFELDKIDPTSLPVVVSINGAKDQHNATFYFHETKSRNKDFFEGKPITSRLIYHRVEGYGEDANVDDLGNSKIFAGTPCAEGGGRCKRSTDFAQYKNILLMLNGQDINTYSLNSFDDLTFKAKIKTDALNLVSRGKSIAGVGYAYDNFAIDSQTGIGVIGGAGMSGAPSRAPKEIFKVNENGSLNIFNESALDDSRNHVSYSFHLGKGATMRSFAGFQGLLSTNLDAMQEAEFGRDSKWCSAPTPGYLKLYEVGESGIDSNRPILTLGAFSSGYFSEQWQKNDNEVYLLFFGKENDADICSPNRNLSLGLNSLVVKKITLNTDGSLNSKTVISKEFKGGSIIGITLDPDAGVFYIARKDFAKRTIIIDAYLITSLDAFTSSGGVPIASITVPTVDGFIVQMSAKWGILAGIFPDGVDKSHYKNISFYKLDINKKTLTSVEMPSTFKEMYFDPATYPVFVSDSNNNRGVIFGESFGSSAILYQFNPAYFGFEQIVDQQDEDTKIETSPLPVFFKEVTSTPFTLKNLLNIFRRKESNM